MKKSPTAAQVPSAVTDFSLKETQVGKFKIQPITLNTLILLERIGSPFMAPPTDETGKPLEVKPTNLQFAETLYILLNAHDPRLDGLLDDGQAWSRSVRELAGTVTLREMICITQALNRIMKELEATIADSGLAPDGEKKDTTTHG